MSLFPRSMFTSDFPRFPSGEFTPLFRLLDDYASHQLSRTGSEATSATTSMSSFRPKFDVKENKDNYELHGELPGIDQKDVQIEFTDASTIVIKGRTERHTDSGTRPSGLLENTPEQPKLADSTTSEHEHYHKPTVEEEDDATTTTTGASGVATPSSSNAIATTTADAQQQQQQQQQQQKKQKSHYWVTERSVGEFHRSFSFPARIDHDAVKASLNNGILSIVVPKSQTPTTRRINIE